MKCLCSKSYTCSNCEDKRELRRLTAMNKIKLLQYKPYLDERKKPDKEMFGLMNYLLDRDIDVSLARLL